MPNDSKRLGELRRQYRDSLLTIANEIGAVERSPANAVALNRIRHALGVPGGKADHQVREAEVGPLLVRYVISLQKVLQEMSGLDVSAENQAIVSEVEIALNSLLQTSP